MLKCDLPRGREVSDLPHKGPKTQSVTRRGQKTMTMMIMMMMMMMKVMMTMMIVMCFLHPKGPQTGGGR